MILTFFVISAALAAPIDSDEIIIEDGPVALPQVEEGVKVVVEEEPVKENDDEEVIEDVDAAFMRMMNMGMFNPYGYNSYQFNPYQYNPMSYGQMMDPAMMGELRHFNSTEEP